MSVCAPLIRHARPVASVATSVDGRGVVLGWDYETTSVRNAETGACEQATEVESCLENVTENCRSTV